MGIKKWYEISYDYCGSAEHFPIGRNIKKQAREHEWIVTAKNKYFCNKTCKKNYTIEYEYDEPVDFVHICGPKKFEQQIIQIFKGE